MVKLKSATFGSGERTKKDSKILTSTKRNWSS